MLNRLRRTDRDELLDAVYGEDASPDHQPRLSVLLSKLRSVRGLECVAAARLGLGGPTLPQAEECGRRLIARPYRESGYRILMEALEQRGNVAEALLVYDRLRLLLHDELGIAPSQTVQRVYRRLLDDTAAART